MKDVTIKFVLSEIKAEYKTYRSEWIAKGAEAVWHNSFNVNAWRCIKDFLLDGELSETEMNRLYMKCNGHILSALVDAYVSSEYCDIAQYSDLKELVKNFLGKE